MQSKLFDLFSSTVFNYNIQVPFRHHSFCNSSFSGYIIQNSRYSSAANAIIWMRIVQFRRPDPHSTHASAAADPLRLRMLFPHIYYLYLIRIPCGSFRSQDICRRIKIKIFDIFCKRCNFFVSSRVRDSFFQRSRGRCSSQASTSLAKSHTCPGIYSRVAAPFPNPPGILSGC